MVCPNGLNKAMIVSLPRSGHHLLVRGLNILLEGQMVYSNHYESKHNLSNCEYVNVQKSHDFDMLDEVNPDLHYIIMVRENQYSAASWFDMLKTHENYSKPLTTFIQDKQEYYSKFIQKYVKSDNIPNRKVITFYDLITNKIKVISEVAQFLLSENYKLKPHHLEHLRRWEIGERNMEKVLPELN